MEDWTVMIYLHEVGREVWNYFAIISIMIFCTLSAMKTFFLFSQRQDLSTTRLHRTKQPSPTTQAHANNCNREVGCVCGAEVSDQGLGT